MSGKKSEKIIKSVQNKLLLIYSILILVITALLSFAFLDKSSSAIKNNAAGLVATDSEQLQININSYFEKVESTTALLFSDEDYYKYDKTSDKYDEYTKLQYEEAIENKIVDLGIMENFSDFGIVYSDNSNVGWISNTTKSLFESENMYEEIVKNITNTKKDNGWFYGVNGNFDRLYYAKRINPNAVAIASFYSRELASLFIFPDELEGMVIRLVSSAGDILYSTDKNEIGEKIDNEYSSFIKGTSRIILVDNDKIVNSDPCNNNWYVITTIPADIVLTELDELRIFTFTIALIVVGFSIIAGTILFIKMTKPMDTMVNDLEIKASLDGLSGMLNKISYEKTINNELDNSVVGCSMVLAILDVDHFKSINDSEGHAYGDEVIKRTASLLKRQLPEIAIKGRIGGDEFSFAFKSASKSLDEMKLYTEEILENLSKEFLKEFSIEHEKYAVSVSIGVCAFQYHGENFETVYKNADAALYVSKEEGRNRYTFYKEGMTGEK